MSERKQKPTAFVLEDAGSSTVRARWSFSPGPEELTKIDHDDFWETTSTVRTASLDSEGDVSLVSHDEFADDVPPLPPRLPPPSPPSDRDLMIEECYKSFREMSLSPTCGAKPRVCTIASPVMSYSSPRPSLRSKRHKGKTQSLQDRSVIQDSLKRLTNFDD